MSRIIRIANDKYQVHRNDDGTISNITRHNKDWGAVDDLRFSGIFGSLLAEFEELQDIIVRCHNEDNLSGDAFTAMDMKATKILEERK